MDVAGVLQVGREVDHCDRQREASCAGRYARCRVSRVGGHGAGGPKARAQHALKTLSNTKFFSGGMSLTLSLNGDSAMQIAIWTFVNYSLIAEGRPI